MSATNQQQFSSQLGEWASKLKIKAATLQKKITFDLHSDIMHRTPVDTGRARANWMATVGAPSKEVHLYEGLKEGDAIPQPPSPPLEIDGTTDTYIINNLAYIKALEDGHSKQAPNGMRRLAMEAEQAKIEEAVRGM